MPNNHPYKIIPNRITKLGENQIFVFGSNTEGKHGAGGALFARQHCDAQYGNPQGLQGRSWGIITKDLSKGKCSIPLPQIKYQISEVINYAAAHPELEFLFSAIGCSLAGYSATKIGGLFADIYLPPNIWLPQEFVDHLIEDKPTLRVVFIGNRRQKFKHPDIWNKTCSSIALLVNRICERAVEWKYQRVEFYSGMALGVDTAVAEIVLEQKNNPNIEVILTAAVPCTNQDAKWKEGDQLKYHQLLSQAKCIKYVSNLPYQEAGSFKCLDNRNKWMLSQLKGKPEHDAVIAIWDGQPGGTANCLNNAMRLGHRVYDK
ncbi:A1S_2505 family phage non-structural protein [Mastigocladopsis repens]|uniref:A1S_2505 family phage non-structural protein n=1 Tax=Mastigocladopsis repens TaxID=221287 RepID=UPI00031ADBE0|nr:SLOG family protein [Mastigocladopsis repens]